MICIEKQMEMSIPDLPRIGRPADVLFFDIETTGLSARTAGLYLIGLLTCTEESTSPPNEALPIPVHKKEAAVHAASDAAAPKWTLRQYFCEDVSDEPEVLRQFFTLLRSKKVLISYNGDGFDLPFLRHTAAQYALETPLEQADSFDLFRRFRPLKRLLSLPDLKLKTCERFLGIDREDRFTGAELISVYQHWQKTREDEALRTLLLHNEEDIAHLPDLLPLLRYTDPDLGQCFLDAHTLTPTEDGSGTLLTLRYRFEGAQPFPQPLNLRDDRWTLQLADRSAVLTVPLRRDELKYFYPNPQDYYYLPSEDCAIHKSLAEFVDRRARKKASAQTCYQRRQGLFLPEAAPVFEPLFRTSFRDTRLYAEYTEALWQDPEKATEYLRSVMACLGIGSS